MCSTELASYTFNFYEESQEPFLSMIFSKVMSNEKTPYAAEALFPFNFFFDDK